MPDFLLELCSEEIPARMQVQAAADLERLIADALRAGQLPFAATHAYAGPRRLALVVEGLADRQPDRSAETRGPRLGAPLQALEGFLRGAGLTSIDQCEVRDTGKGEFYFAVKQVPGKDVAELLAEIVPAALDAFPWPKSMRWGGNRQRWVRPLHHILAILYGEGETRVVPITWRLGETDIVAGNESKGHRFLAPGSFVARDFAEYRAQLNDRYVILDFEERRQSILDQARTLCAGKGLRLKEDEALSREVAGLVEWPVALIGDIDPAFMELPPEVLTTSMRSHQKYFACETADGTLAPFFIVVANNVTADGGAQIVAGNERVLRARLSDAKFFWDMDKKANLELRLGKLEERVFHAKLGTVRAKVWRIEALTSLLVQEFHSSSFVKDQKLAVRAAHLAKADLSSGLVGEFPELQGIVGSHIAHSQGEPSEVVEAIREHYLPAGPHDGVPNQPVSVVVALADRIDTLAQFFAISEKPTGSKDPYALRRAGLGIIRLIRRNSLRINLRRFFALSLERISQPPADLPAVQSPIKWNEIPAIAADLMEFIIDRLKVALRDEGIRHDLISAAFGNNEEDIVRAVAKARALQSFVEGEDGANLLIAYRRAARIVEIEERKDGRSYNNPVNFDLYQMPQEYSLHVCLHDKWGQTIAKSIADEHFESAMYELADLREDVDNFFDKVTVNVDDPILRDNRLRLLSFIRNQFNSIADFSKIEG